MERLIEWQFVAMPHRRSRALRALAGEPDQVIADVTSAARRCVDDGAALRVVRVLHGVGPALGSAALMSMNASRWTVLDVRALASIRAVGYFDVPDHAQRGSMWLPAVPRRVPRPRGAHQQRPADSRSRVVRRERLQLAAWVKRCGRRVDRAWRMRAFGSWREVLPIDGVDDGRCRAGLDLEPGVEEPTRHQPSSYLDPSDTPPARRRPGVLDRDPARLAARRSRGIGTSRSSPADTAQGRAVVPLAA